MTEVEKLIQEYAKCYVPYKVAVYLCGCKYIHIEDEEKQVLKEYSFCPEHKVGKDHMILWCETCGLTIKAIPRAGHRQKRCPVCAKAYLKEYNKRVWYEKYGKKEKSPIIKKKREEIESKKYERLAKYRYRKFLGGLGQRLPVVETPMLDKYLRKGASQI